MRHEDRHPSPWASALRALGRLVEVHRGEASTALLLFAYSFLAMTAYNIVRPATRSTFITGFGAHNLPFIQLAAGLLIGLLMHGYTRAVRALPQRAVVPVTQAGLVALLLAFWALLGTGAAWAPVAFYLLGQVLGILLISQFWTVANDTFDARQAKRLFGFIGGGASLGGALGAGITSVTVATVGTRHLLLLSAGVLAVSMAVVAAILQRLPATARREPAADAPHDSGGESIRLLFASPHIRVIVLVIGCVSVGAVLVEQQLNMAAESIAGAAATDVITRFLAQVTMYLSLAGFLVQVGLTSRVHRSLGLGVALMLLPVGLGSSALVILVSGAVWAAAAAKVLDGTLRYSIDKTSRELLFLPLPADLKYRIKPFIDVAAERVAKALGALLLLVLIQPWGLGLDWQELSYVSVALVGLWMVAAVLARREYRKAFRASLGARTLAPESVRIDVGDTATVETVVEQLSSPDDEAVLYAIAVLEAIDKRHLVTPLLLHHQSPRVRARALVALGTARPDGAAHWMATARRMLEDADAGVRAAAVRALAVLEPEAAAALLESYLRDPEPRVAATAAVGLVALEPAAGIGGAFATLHRLVDGDSAARLEAARALAHIRHPQFSPLLVPLLHDADPGIAREAIRSARDAGAENGLFVPALLSLLGHPTLRGAARDALAGYGTDITDALEYVLRDRRESRDVRRHVPATLALAPSQRSVDLLLEALDDTDGVVRGNALMAIERVHRQRPDLPCDPEGLDRLLLKETSRYYNYFSLRHNLAGHAAAQRALLVRALDEEVERLQDRVYRLLRLRYPGRGVEDARCVIEQGDTRRRAAAVEYLDTLLERPLRRRVMPLLDEMPAEEKVRFANLVLKSRPRDIDDTLAQLVHDDEPVVAAAAIHFAAEQQIRSLADDYEYVLAHRAAGDRAVLEAALGARAGIDPGAGPSRASDLPLVEVVHRLRHLPLGRQLAIDDLFRVAEGGRQAWYAPGHELAVEGAPAGEMAVLLEGAVHCVRGGSAPVLLAAPAVLALNDVLRGGSYTDTIVAAGRVHVLGIQRAAILALLAERASLARGVFRLLLPAPDGSPLLLLETPDVPAGGTPRHGMLPVDTVLLLRRHPIFTSATPAQLFDLAAVTSQVVLAEGHPLFTPEQPAAIYHVLDGELHMDSAAPVGRGVTIGVGETLAGLPMGRRAVVTREGRALRLTHDDLYAVLSDRTDLLQGLLRAVLEPVHAGAPRAAVNQVQETA